MLLVTGANGHTAKYFFEHLSALGHAGPIRCVFRAPERAAGVCFPALNLEYVYGDLDDKAFLHRALTGVDTVLHIAGIHHSRPIVRIGKKKGVSWFILIHTTARYSRFRMAFEHYVDIEDTLIANHRNLTILRPTMIYGSSMDRNMWKLIGVLARTPVFPVFGSGDNLMQPVFARDLAKAYWAVLQNRKTVMDQQYNLSGRTAISYRQLLKTVAKELRRTVFLLPLPTRASVWVLRKLQSMLKRELPIKDEQILRLSEDKDFAWQAAQRDFGYDPTAFEQGIAVEVAEWRAAQVQARTQAAQAKKSSASG